MSLSLSTGVNRYADAGVHLAVADEIATHVRDRLGTGLFGGFVPVSALKEYEAPLLVSSLDGIGTKTLLAARLGDFRGLGEDIVHHCVNDIAVHGAWPLFFLDYLAFHRLDTGVVAAIVESIAAACARLDVQLAGGETAEMPLVYPPGHFDVAGAIVGVVEERAVVDGRAIVAGDIVLGLPSSGLHTNGYSLVQRLLSDGDLRRYDPLLGMTIGEALLVPHRCYLREIRTLLGTDAVHGLAHITGGGISGNLSRIMPAGVRARIALPSLPPLFARIQARGVPLDEMERVFNLGTGLIAVCDPAILARLDGTDGENRLPFLVLGRVEEATGDRLAAAAVHIEIDTEANIPYNTRKEQQ